MRQLSGMDASFLHMENERTIGHVAGLMVLDPSTASHEINADTVRDYFAARLHLLPPLRWRLVDVPFGIDRPYWQDDPAPDLDYHVRGIALPKPGNSEQLAAQISRLASRRLDRGHPLWEVYVIEGLEGGRVGIMSKFHHAAIDGKAGMQILSTLLSTDPASPPPKPPADWPAERVEKPSDWEMLARGGVGLLGRPEQSVRFMLDSVRETCNYFKQFGIGADAWAPLKTTLKSPTAPRVSFNTTLSARRNWAAGTVSLDQVKDIKNRHDCTINDVVMAACSGALRRWLLDHDELPKGPLKAMVPVSIRTAEQAATAGNQVSAMVASLATDVEDPGERLQAVRAAMKAAKGQHDALPANLLQDFSQFAAPAAAELVARTAATMRWADRMPVPFNVVISNVPGPRESLYFDGALMEANYPISIVTDGAGLNITVQSYRDSLDIGLVSTPELMPDLPRMIDHLRDSLDELAAIPSHV